MAIKAVFFDIGNVLLKFSSRDILRRLSRGVGCPPRAISERVWNGPVMDLIERGRMSGADLHRFFVKELGYVGSPAQFAALWGDHFELDRGSFSILKRLSRQLPTYLLSNTNELHIEFIRRRYSFPEVVTGAILSHEVGLRKPEAGIYHAALKLSRTKPQETIFIDDLAENCAGAREVGLHAIHYQGAPDLRARLRAHGLTL